MKKILIVEDDYDTRVSYRKTLEEEGYTVVTTTKGKSALEALKKQNSVGLILLDMNMPIMDGNEFLKIRSGDPALATIPVVVVAAQDESVAYPVSGILRKPIDSLELLATVKRFLLK